MEELIVGGTVLFTLLITGFTICISVLAALLPVAIVGAVFYYVWQQGKSRQLAVSAARSWPSTQGVVTHSTVDMENRGSGGVAFVPKVEYEYTVGGVKYQGNVLRAGNQFMRVLPSSMSEAQHQIIMYPPGASVAVFYNPANPAESALEVVG